jgi:wyosine [tRNA(Phe)-imidazoG37] synthetase (radical SAM superfamily)
MNERNVTGHIFGPVPSRRLGRSLGVDIVPFKTCTYDCIYCQLGRTTHKMVDRCEWFPLDDILEELRDKLAAKPDYITLSGSGEPTLYSRLDELIDRIRAMTDIPVAVLTNGSLLWQPELRRQLMNANLVIPSLDAGDSAVFDAVNRPHHTITFEKMLEGLVDFRREYKGAYWLEVLLVAGYNAVQSSLKGIIDCIKRIGPDRVQLNTATRPPADKYAYPVSQSRLMKLSRRFDPPAEVIADYRGVHTQEEFRTGQKEVLEMILRRPCSKEDIAQGLCMHRNEVIKYMEKLTALGKVETQKANGHIFYCGKRTPAIIKS